MNCYNCDVVLNRKNRSVEHIINASIGGFRKGYNLLCHSCNMAFGRTIDFELGRQLGVFGRLLGIQLDRGEHSTSSSPGAVIDCDRAIAKICLNYYLSRGYAKEYISTVRDFVRGESTIPVSFYYLPADIHEADEVSHIIHIHGGAGVLYAYIELFNMQNRVVVFSRDYAGKDIHVTYCRDVVKGVELDKEVPFRLGREELERLKSAAGVSGERYEGLRDDGMVSGERYEGLRDDGVGSGERYEGLRDDGVGSGERYEGMKGDGVVSGERYEGLRGDGVGSGERYEGMKGDGVVSGERYNRLMRMIEARRSK